MHAHLPTKHLNRFSSVVVFSGRGSSRLRVGSVRRFIAGVVYVVVKALELRDSVDGVGTRYGASGGIPETYALEARRCYVAGFWEGEREGGKEGRREGGREGGREKGREGEGEREGGKEGGREGEGQREGGIEVGREGEREGGRERERGKEGGEVRERGKEELEMMTWIVCMYTYVQRNTVIDAITANCMLTTFHQRTKQHSHLKLCTVLYTYKCTGSMAAHQLKAALQTRLSSP